MQAEVGSGRIRIRRSAPDSGSKQAPEPASTREPPPRRAHAQREAHGPRASWGTAQAQNRAETRAAAASRSSELRFCFSAGTARERRAEGGTKKKKKEVMRW